MRALLAFSLIATAVAIPAHAGTGSTFKCPIEGEIPATVYLDITARDVTLDVQGKRYETNATHGKFEIHTNERQYYFNPKWNAGQGTLTIVTENENRTVKCSGR